MNNQEFIQINKDGWNSLVRTNKPFSNTSLPEYGPFLKRTEDDIGIFEKTYESKILDIGCGEGESLEYLYKKGAAELWGVDISEEQIKKCKARFPQFSDNFIVSPMEFASDLPKNYFDYIISIFSIGYSSDLYKTLVNANKYLKNNGSIIISWTHPFYYCLDINDDKVILNKPYFNEDTEIIQKGPDKINLAQNNLMISTIINIANEAGLYVNRMYEEETVLKDMENNGYKSSFWRKEKTENCPSTIIYVLKKIKNY